jgi:uncharacterized protein YjbI with pentapeptide repeats
VVFTDVDWEEVIDAEFHSCTFVGADLHEALARNTRFVDCRFEGSDLSLWRPTDSSLGGSQFKDCRMLGIDWTLATWPPVSLHDPNQFLRCDLSMGTFANLDLGPVVFEECRLREVSFREARMLGARLDGSDCLGADFQSADLREAGLMNVDGLLVDPRTTELAGATVDAATGVAILEMLGIKLGEEFAGELPGPV